MRGPIFCGNTNYVPTDKAQECVDKLSMIDVASVKVLGQLVKVSAERICKENGCE